MGPRARLDGLPYAQTVQHRSRAIAQRGGSIRQSSAAHCYRRHRLDEDDPQACAGQSQCQRRTDHAASTIATS